MDAFRSGRKRYQGSLSSEDCAILSRRIEIMLRRGNWDGVQGVVSEAKRLAVQLPETITLDSPISELGLSTRLRERLEKHGRRTVGDVARLTEAEILLMAGSGPRAVEETRECVRMIAEQILSRRESDGLTLNGIGDRRTEN